MEIGKVLSLTPAVTNYWANIKPFLDIQVKETADINKFNIAAAPKEEGGYLYSIPIFRTKLSL